MSKSTPRHYDAQVDRIYLNAPNTIVIADGGNKRSITITKSNLPDAVVWNPWIDKAKATADLGDEEYKVFLCVEAGAIGTPIVLKAGEEWEAPLLIAAIGGTGDGIKNRRLCNTVPNLPVISTLD
eukprot:jgi/Chlat1/4732/Chrsp30S04771